MGKKVSKFALLTLKEPSSVEVCEGTQLKATGKETRGKGASSVGVNL